MSSLKYLSLVCVLVLSACGGSDNANPTPTTPPVTPPVGMVDAFFAKVMAIIGDGGETTTEPEATDAVAVTTPVPCHPAW